MSTTRPEPPDPYVNRYTYAGNNPMNFIDPLGLQMSWNGGDCPSDDPCPEDFLGPDFTDRFYLCELYGFCPGDGPHFWGPGGRGGGDGSPAGNSCAGPNPPVTCANAANNKYDCLNYYNNSPLGKGIQFFSLYKLATDFKNSWKEWTLFPGIKMGAAHLLNKASQAFGNTEFWSITSTAAEPASQVLAPTAAGVEAIEGVGKRAALPAVVFATSVDIGVQAQCAGAPAPPISVFVPTF